MKKGLFLIPLAAAMMASCANNDFDAENGGATGETETRYLAVNIVDAAAGTRAANDDTDYEAGKDGTNNQRDENSVKTIRFYLFGASGATNTSVDVTAEALTDKSTNIEKKLQAVIVYEEEKTSGSTPAAPTQIVAVVNPPASLETSYSTPAALQDVLVSTDLAKSGEFVMSTSVFVETVGSEKKEHVADPITTSYTSREAALAAPVEIYVERVVAKTRVESNLKAATGDGVAPGLYTIQSSKGEDPSPTTTAKAMTYADGVGTEKEIYLKLLGWDVTATAPKSRLVKKVQTGWDFDWGSGNVWNKPAFYRSFWAQNPSDVASQGALTFGKFTDIYETANNKDFTGNLPIYHQENASWGADGKTPDYPTKLIVAAQLVDKDGVGINLAWWKGSYYLESALLQAMASESKIYSKSGTTYTPISADILKFKTATAVEGSSASIRYFSYAQLDDDKVATEVTGKEWYTKSGTGEWVAIDGDLKTAINGKLKALGVAKVWDQGYTYYWTDIAHLGIQDYGDYGIVRNHIYAYELTSFVGFGIPVLNPEETIIPEEPNDPEFAYIAAKLNILSWRLVNHSETQLGWE